MTIVNFLQSQICSFIFIWRTDCAGKTNNTTGPCTAWWRPYCSLCTTKHIQWIATFLQAIARTCCSHQTDKWSLLVKRIPPFRLWQTVAATTPSPGGALLQRRGATHWSAWKSVVVEKSCLATCHSDGTQLGRLSAAKWCFTSYTSANKRGTNCCAWLSRGTGWKFAANNE